MVIYINILWRASYNAEVSQIIFYHLLFPIFVLGIMSFLSNASRPDREFLRSVDGLVIIMLHFLRKF